MATYGYRKELTSDVGKKACLDTFARYKRLPAARQALHCITLITFCKSAGDNTEQVDFFVTRSIYRLLLRARRLVCPNRIHFSDWDLLVSRRFHSAHHLPVTSLQIRIVYGIVLSYYIT